MELRAAADVVLKAFLTARRSQEGKAARRLLAFAVHAGETGKARGGPVLDLTQTPRRAAPR